MKPSSTPQRYSPISMAFHWVIVGLMVGLFVIGYRMTRLPDEDISDIFTLYQLHKSLGVTVLLLTGLRILHRVLNKPPYNPFPYKKWEKRAASLAHFCLYSLCLLVPLLGWAMVSASPYNIPTVLFDLWTWPHLPPFDTLADKPRAEAVLKTIHRAAAYSMLALILLHALAAIGHHTILKNHTLLRVLPRFIMRDPGISAGMED